MSLCDTPRLSREVDEHIPNSYFAPPCPPFPLLLDTNAKATEHGNSDVLAAYLHAGGDPTACSRLHHMAWSLLHLATGCATAMGGEAGESDS